MQNRVSLPRTFGKDDLLAARLIEGRRLIEFDDIVFEWSDARRLVRDAADLLLRFDLIEPADAAFMNGVVRDGAALPVMLRGWYDEPLIDTSADAASPPPTAGRTQTCLVAMRPYLARGVTAVQSFLSQVSGARQACPVCAGEADFTVWSANGRSLVCGRCTAKWPFPEGSCAFCGDDHAEARKSFAGGSRAYRLEACEVCRRYIKGFDERGASRPMILSVDTIATLPLDVAAMQLGFE